MAVLLIFFSVSPLAAEEPLTVAVPKDFPPHYSLDAEGRPDGFAIDVFDALAAQANLDFRYRVYPSWSETFAAVKNGEASLIPNVGISDARKVWADFTRPVETFPVVTIVRHGSPVAELADLAGRRVAVVKANVGAKLLKKRPELNTVQFDTANDALVALLSGDVDGWVYPLSVAMRSARRAGLQDRIKVVGEPVKEILRGIAVGKGHGDLVERLDTAVAAEEFEEAARLRDEIRRIQRKE